MLLRCTKRRPLTTIPICESTAAISSSKSAAVASDGEAMPESPLHPTGATKKARERTSGEEENALRRHFRHIGPNIVELTSNKAQLVMAHHAMTTIPSPRPPPLSTLELCRPVNDFGKFLLDRQRYAMEGCWQHPCGENGLRSLGLRELVDRKKELKSQLKQYEKNFAKQYGRKPLGVEFGLVRHLCDSYTELRKRIEAVSQQQGRVPRRPAAVGRPSLPKKLQTPKQPPYAINVESIIKEMFHLRRAIEMDENPRRRDCRRYEELSDLTSVYTSGKRGLLAFS